MRRTFQALLTVPVLALLAACSSTAGAATPATPAGASSAVPATTAAAPTALDVNSTADLKAAWGKAGLACAKPKATETLYATEALDCDKDTTLSYFATAAGLRQQDKMLRLLGKQGLAKEKVLQGATWTIQSTTPRLLQAQKAFGGKLTDPEKAGL